MTGANYLDQLVLSYRVLHSKFYENYKQFKSFSIKIRGMEVWKKVRGMMVGGLKRLLKWVGMKIG